MPMLPDFLPAILATGRAVAAHRAAPRAVVPAEGWTLAGEALAAGALTLAGLWGDRGAVHAALLDEAAGALAVVSLDCPAGSFPSLARTHPPAIRPERTIRDLFGLEPVGLPDPRPWPDHGRWGVRHPLGTSREAPATGLPYAFLPVEGEALHQIPVGPVHAGIIEPGHFRFTASGETVVRLEERLGYVHKGIEGLMEGATPAEGARLAGRTSGDSTVAYAFAYARAVEAALDAEPPPRAVWLRALMAELERLANHFGDIGAICNDAAFAIMLAHCGVLRERVLRAAHAAFGHRLMMDRVVPGGVTVDLAPAAADGIRALLATARAAFPPLVRLYDETTSLQDRTVGTGRVDAALVRRFGAGGYVGRASGRAFDTRRALPYAPYEALRFEVPVRTTSDVDARVWVRIEEVRQSLDIVAQILDGLPAGPIMTALAPTGAAAEATVMVEGFRGDVLAHVRLGGDGRIERCHLRDPSWFQWPLLEVAIEGNIVADFPLCNKSFNCSYSGHDL